MQNECADKEFIERIEKTEECSQAQLEKEHYHALLKTAKENEILWGTVCALQMSESLANHFNVLVEYEGYIITIPDFLYFTENHDFGKNYPNMNEKEKCSRRFNAAQYQLNAYVPFVLIHNDKVQIRRKKLDNNLYDDGYIVEVFADRNKAMEKLRMHYFFEENADRIRPDSKVQAEDIVRNGHVLSVKEDNVQLEVCGCEVRLDAYHLNTSYVDNCCKFVSAGDEIPVRIKKITLNSEAKTVQLAVSGRLFANNKMIATMRPGDVMLGTVDSYSEVKDTYTVVLRNGIKAACQGDTVSKKTPLAIGDLVMVYVRFINENENFVSGRITKL